ncbi:DNA repair exonuclease [Geobacter sulfurreducens]|jgi:exonuclease SbcD|uniref:metallophosphoesterase family protein n=1 Tax=Geobacter TaxID=28231 RepID=UPI0005D7DB68|nr:DNA repair exonuclease [Geobacter sulfurreducens]BET57798.1 DNA repair exonuclease [Geobacter sp. 60473]AJY71697.1 nuclease SbcCD subunit D [Geobacter sulfurreducens]QVW36603.1 DNA repair exonuclease [Geobacter sulfurreducens]UTG94070.1 DNA repair exonuclease [Geobacter sulfurreducens]BEH10592.1 DNA repair exonuclease [Geobacter sulfurreducens subsp. ethanolicus]
MPIRFLHTADLHLDSPLRTFGDLARERRRDFLKTFDRIVNLAIKREVDCVLIAGDLFDSTSVGAETVGRVQDAFSRLAGRGVQVVLIPGTHDNIISAESVYSRYQFTGVHILREPAVDEPLRLDIRGEAVFFYGFAYRSDRSREALESMRRRSGDGIHVGLLHGSLKGNPEWEMRKKDIPFSVADLVALDLDYIALGHYHDAACLEEGGRVIACYPGSPEGKKFGENGPRYALIVEVAPGNASVERVEVQTRIIREFNVDASLFAEPAALEAELARLGTSDTVGRIRLCGTVEEPLDTANLSGRVKGNFAWLELVDETDLYNSGHVKRMEREDSIRGLFIRKIHERYDAAGSDAERELCRDALRLVMGRFSRGGGN